MIEALKEMCEVYKKHLHFWVPTHFVASMPEEKQGKSCAEFAGYKKERWNFKHVSSMPEERQGKSCAVSRL